MKNAKKEIAKALNDEPYNPDLPLDGAVKMLNAMIMVTATVGVLGITALVKKMRKFFKRQDEDAG